MKILVAVDGSEHSLNAVHCAITYANRHRETPSVELVHVHLPPPRLFQMGTVASEEEIRRGYDEEGSLALMSAKLPLDASGIVYNARILVGPIAESIVEHAVKTGCDLIVLATRGMGAAANQLLGSTATQVLHISSMPVLMAK